MRRTIWSCAQNCGRTPSNRRLKGRPNCFLIRDSFSLALGDALVLDLRDEWKPYTNMGNIQQHMHHAKHTAQCQSHYNIHTTYITKTCKQQALHQSGPTHDTANSK